MNAKLKEEQIASFDPNGVGLKNGHFIGLPFTEETAELILLPVPWDLTVSYGRGTATGPINILEASTQLDLYDSLLPNAWKEGIYMRPVDNYWLKLNQSLNDKAEILIEEIERGEEVAHNPHLKDLQDHINEKCASLHHQVYLWCKELLEQKKKIGIVGGSHSVPLGFFKALSEKYNDFGILQIDAHKDLRPAYEGFTYSHASTFYNALENHPQISKLVQIGIRDYCQQELDYVKDANGRIEVLYDQQLQWASIEGRSIVELIEDSIAHLPQQVYISFDIDGLDPKLCPHTGTPVPGGLSLAEAFYILHYVVKSGRTIIGFDLSEVAGLGHTWDGNVGARVLYKLSALVLSTL